MRITCKTKGVPEIVKKIGKYDAEITQNISNVVNDSLKNIAKGARSRLPTSKTGNLRKGLKKSFSKKNITGFVKEKAFHSHLIEFGTRPHEIAVKTKKVLVIEGGMAGKEVMHPGAKPHPFMQPAYYAEKRNYVSNLIKAVNKI